MLTVEGNSYNKKAMLDETKPRMRLLVAITSWGTGNDRFLAQLVSEYQSMAFDVDIIVLSNSQKTVPPGVEVVSVPFPGIKSPSFRRMIASVQYPWLIPQEYREWKKHMGFPFAHKKMFADRLDDYDLFLFSEDDTLVTERNLRAFQEMSAVMAEDEVPGFLRYEENPEGGRNYPEVHGRYHWDPASVRTRAGHTLAFFSNEHAACYVLTQQQLRRAIDSGGFLVEPHSEKYDLLCTAATDPYTQCGFQKLIPISRLDDFLIHHLPNKYVGTSYGIDDQELRRQTEALGRTINNGHKSKSLFQTETKLEHGIYSKNYYDPVQPGVISAIPDGTRTVLSIGCGWGAMEAALKEKGMKVTAIPIDPIIPGVAAAKGVEIVTGDFNTVREKLAGRSFDCMLMSNMLHLLPNPVEILSSFAALLSPSGVIVAVIPNTVRLGAKAIAIWKNGRKPGGTEYEATGMQLSSSKKIRGWFNDAGLSIKSVQNVLDPPAQKYGRLAMGLADSWIASEYVVVANTGQKS